ncbi:MAG: alpha-galactosidase [Spirochaetia bacterium]|nr:alpha-galactosidase [Spirochaetia bacterium]
MFAGSQALCSISYELNGTVHSYELPLVWTAGRKTEVLIGCRFFYFKNTYYGYAVYSISLEVAPGERIRLKKLALHCVSDREVIRLFSNGFQSWSTSGERDLREKQRKMNPLLLYWRKKYKLDYLGDAHFADAYASEKSGQSGVVRSYTFAYGVKKPDESRRDPRVEPSDAGTAEEILFIGSTDESFGYTIIEMAARGKKLETTVFKECEGLELCGDEGCGNTVSEKVGENEGGNASAGYGSYALFSLFCGEEKRDNVFGYWAKRVRHSSPAGKKAKKPTEPSAGWTSWYRYYEKIDEACILKNLRSFSEANVPLDYFQIDDGWQNAVGDWLEVKDSFPRGMKPIADAVNAAGYTPGLWLAPFAAEASSRLFREHPDWVVHDAYGKPVPAGNNPFNWSGYFYALKYEIPEVRNYLEKVFSVLYTEWGFRLVKLDFLYVAGIKPRNGKSRGMIMQQAMDLLHAIIAPYEDLKVLACGVPLASAFFFADYCRIGSDVSPKWEDRRLAFMRFPERVSTSNSLKSTVGRNMLNYRFFVNDPDVFFLRKEGVHMTESQKHSLFLANNIFGGLIFTSDNFGQYSFPEKSLYCSHFPVRQKKILSIYSDRGFIHVSFLIERLKYIAFINLTSRGRSAELPEGSDTLWYSRTDGFMRGAEHVELSGYESRCFLRSSKQAWGVMGSTSRLFPGSEVKVSERNGKFLQVELHERTMRPGTIYIRTPKHIDNIIVNKRMMQVEDCVGVPCVKLNGRDTKLWDFHSQT